MEKKKRARHHNPQPFIRDDDSIASTNKRTKASKNHQKQENMISSGLSSKILKEALMQQKEIQEEAEVTNPTGIAFALAEEENARDQKEDEEEDLDDFNGSSETETQFGDYDDIDENEEKLLEAFLSKDAGPQRTLADLIMEKIKQKDLNVSSEAPPLPKLDESIIGLYEGSTSVKMKSLFKKVARTKAPVGRRHRDDESPHSSSTSSQAQSLPDAVRGGEPSNPPRSRAVDISRMPHFPAGSTKGRGPRSSIGGLRHGQPVPVCFDEAHHVYRDTGRELNKNAGGIGTLKEWWRTMPQVVKERVKIAGFADWADRMPLSAPKTCRGSLTALVERWMDSTHTFHLPVGEMTISPVDFAAITGFSFHGDHLPLDWGLVDETADPMLLARLIGDLGLGRRVQLTQIRKFWDGKMVRPDEIERIDQYARTFILILLSGTLFSSGASDACWAILPALADLDRASSYDWGSAALAHLFFGLDCSVRDGQNRLVKGLSVVVLAWAFEYGVLYTQDAPALWDRSFPRFCKWYSSWTRAEMRSVEDRRVELAFLDWSQIITDPWGTEYSWSAEMRDAHRLTYWRVLMEGPWSWEFYLGERIMGWILGPVMRLVPPPPPATMFWISGLLDEIRPEELEGARAGRIEESVEGSYIDHMQLLLPLWPPKKYGSRHSGDPSTSKNKKTGVSASLEPETSRGHQDPTGASASAPPSFVPGTLAIPPRRSIQFLGLHGQLTSRTLTEDMSLEVYYNPADTTHVPVAEVSSMYRLYEAMQTTWRLSDFTQATEVARLSQENHQLRQLLEGQPGIPYGFGPSGAGPPGVGASGAGMFGAGTSRAGTSRGSGRTQVYEAGDDDDDEDSEYEGGDDEESCSG